MLPPRSWNDHFESVDEVMNYIQEKVVKRSSDTRLYFTSDCLLSFIDAVTSSFYVKPVREEKDTRALALFDSPASSSVPVSVEVEDWFADALTLSWDKFIWPKLFERGWQRAMMSVERSISVIMMPGVIPGEIMVGKNAFSSEDDLRRYLLVLHSQWLTCWNHTAGPLNTGGKKMKAKSTSPTSVLSLLSSSSSSSTGKIKQESRLTIFVS